MRIALDIKLGRVLRARRGQLELARAEVAWMATLNVSTIERIENGEVSPTVDAAAHLRRVGLFAVGGAAGRVGAARFE